MTDELDLASEREQIARDCAIAAARHSVSLTAAGRCFYCDEPVVTGLRWCGPECRDGWQVDQEAERRAGG